MAIVIVADWPTRQRSFDQWANLTPEGQLKVAKEKASEVLSHAMAKHPGEHITIAYGFAGFVPHDR